MHPEAGREWYESEIVGVPRVARSFSLAGARGRQCSRCSRLSSPGSCFFFRIPRPPSSPLFPYTTLFRSSIEAAGLNGDMRAVCKTSSEYALPIPAMVDWLDRKSTRLNSSHVAISYAVFCLKKKRECAARLRHASRSWTRMVRIRDSRCSACCPQLLSCWCSRAPVLSLFPSLFTWFMFFFPDPPATELAPLSLHDALPIFDRGGWFERRHARRVQDLVGVRVADTRDGGLARSEEHTSELQSRGHLVCRLLLEKKKRMRRPTPSCIPKLDANGTNPR